MDMNRFKKLALFALMGVLTAQILPAKEVLSADYNPTTEESDLDKKLLRLFGHKITATHDDIVKWVHASPQYKEMHPKLKKWVDQNKDNYKAVSHIDYILYRNNEAGFEIMMQKKATSKYLPYLALNRTYFRDPEDAAWDYEQTPAINPKTKKTWINLDKKEIQLIVKNTKQNFSDTDKAYLKDLLSILNENFHFYYGEKFVTTDKIKDPAELIGKYRPLKVRMYGAFDDFLPPESDQKRELSRKLGRPLYHFYQGFDGTEPLGQSSNCYDKATVKIKLKDGQTATMTYWNQVSGKDVDKMRGQRAAQVWTAKYNLEKLSKHLTALMQEKGVDVDTAKENTTPLTQALYLINLKTQNYIHTIVNDRYVLESKGTEKGADNFEGYKALYEAVPLPKKLKPVKELGISPEPITSNNHIPAGMCLMPVHTR